MTCGPAESKTNSKQYAYCIAAENAHVSRLNCWGDSYHLSICEYSPLLLWYYYDIIMILLWYYYDIIMILLWYYYDIIMILLWYYFDIILILLLLKLYVECAGGCVSVWVSMRVSMRVSVWVNLQVSVCE
jgi:hypothetical protein